MGASTNLYPTGLMLLAAGVGHYLSFRRIPAHQDCCVPRNALD